MRKKKFISDSSNVFTSYIVQSVYMKSLTISSKDAEINNMQLN